MKKNILKICSLLVVPFFLHAELYEVSQSSQADRKGFERNDLSEVVLDPLRGLMWQDNAEVMTLRVNWENAINYCQELNFAEYGDWRLPTRMELHTITDKSKHTLAIQDGFVNVVSDYYWSATKDALSPAHAWDFHFGYGSDFSDDRLLEGYVRCVRDVKEEK